MKDPSLRPEIQTVVTDIEGFCSQREGDKLNCPFTLSRSKEVDNAHLHAYPSFDPDTFTPHVMLLVEFPKSTIHTELVAFIHRQHSQDSQRDGSNAELLNDPSSVEQQVDGCTRCPTSLFITCKSKAYATYESDDLITMPLMDVLEKSGTNLKGPKLFVRNTLHRVVRTLSSTSGELDFS